jgi:YegS/Rv2252/BmrU family lipid kinase
LTAEQPPPGDTQRRYVLLVNPHSAGGRTIKLLPEVQRELDAQGLTYRTVQTRSLEHGVDEAERAVEAGEVPVVMSGDGLIGQVGGALAETDSPMGVIPGGRGNDLARVLGIPSDPAGAVGVLADGNDRQIDVGVVNDKRFLCVASTGFDAECNRIANETRIVKGNLVYAYSVPRAMVAWRTATFEVAVDGGEPKTYRGFSVAIANSRAYGGGMFVAPHAELDDGRFDIIVIEEISKLRYLSNLPKVFKGTHVEEDGVIELPAAGSTVTVSADREFGVYADGEHLADLPATLRILPRALRVISPPAESAPPAPAQP